MTDITPEMVTMELLKANMKLADANASLAERVSRLESQAATPAAAAPAAISSTGVSAASPPPAPAPAIDYRDKAVSMETVDKDYMKLVRSMFTRR
jgi:hypothetical protein